MAKPDTPPSADLDAAALLAMAREGGPGAAKAAKLLAAHAEVINPKLAREALSLACKLEPVDAAPRLGLARLHAEAGDLDAARAEASAVFAEAVDQAARARAAFILGEIARVLGERANARSAYKTALSIEDAILKADRSDPTAARWYARARGRIAELDLSEGADDRARVGAEGALALLRATAASIGEPPVLAADIADAELRLAALDLEDGQPASARRRLGEAIGRYEALSITETQEPHWRAVLSDAWALAAQADLTRGVSDGARQAMEKSLQARLVLAARHDGEAWALAGVWRQRGHLRAALGDHDEAAQSFAQARRLCEHLCGEDKASEGAARFLMRTLIDQTDHALATGALGAARDAADAAREIAERFARSNGGPWFSDLAMIWDRLAEVARAGGAKAQSREAFSRAVEFRRRASAADADDPRLRRGIAAALLKMGDAALADGDHASARAVLHESVILRQELLDAVPDDPRAAHALAAALERLGLAALAGHDADTARLAWVDELALCERIFADANAPEALRFRAIVEGHLAGAGGQDARDYRNAALAHLRQLAEAVSLTAPEMRLREKLAGG
jgi:tetratricopeptide (TPR) repeat protein